jgi:hypothetical protein
VAGGRIAQRSFTIVSSITVGFIDERDEINNMMDFPSRTFRVVLSKPEPLKNESGKSHRGHMVSFIGNLIATRRGTSSVDNFGDNAGESGRIRINDPTFDVLDLIEVQESVLARANSGVFAGPKRLTFVLKV